jgi:DNA-binding NtrC family response regulator
LESELFGHERGAFTGADRRRIGKFEKCNGGTIFLDEAGDMPLALQAKVLRLVQDQTFERVGGNETVRTDVRLIAATHRDLKAWSAEGKFRPDLYYRLGVVAIHLPPLRDRGADLSALVNVYLHRFNRELGGEVREVDPEAMKQLRAYSWPGNVRELQSVLLQALLKTRGKVLLPPSLPAYLTSGAQCRGATETAAPFRPGITLAEMERELVQRYLIQSGGNRQRTAELLGISTRTLLRKISEYTLEDPLRPTGLADAEGAPSRSTESPPRPDDDRPPKESPESST